MNYLLRKWEAVNWIEVAIGYSMSALLAVILFWFASIDSERQQAELLKEQTKILRYQVHAMERMWIYTAFDDPDDVMIAERIVASTTLEEGDKLYANWISENAQSESCPKMAYLMNNFFFSWIHGWVRQDYREACKENERES